MKDASKFYHLVSELFWFMPNGLNQKNEALENPLLNLFIKFEITSNESVTFFGGSFNPLHQGHLECLRQCPEKNIIVIPDCNPHKIQSVFDREKELLDLANRLKDFKVNLYPKFFLTGTPNPTSEWITKVKVPDVNFLMGDDTFMSLMKWKMPEVFLMRLTKLYVVPRLFQKEDYLSQIEELGRINKKLEIIILENHKFRDLSSKKFREN